MSLSDLAAEALSGSTDETDPSKRVEEALACPCIGDLKEGPCGPKFVEAFRCFILSEHEDKGMDCLDQFKTFQVCLSENPDFERKIMEGSKGEETGDAGGGAALEGELQDAPALDAASAPAAAAPLASTQPLAKPT